MRFKTEDLYIFDQVGLLPFIPFIRNRKKMDLPVIHIPARRPLHERNERTRQRSSRSLTSRMRRLRGQRRRSASQTIQINNSDDDDTDDPPVAGVCIDLTSTDDDDVIDLTSPLPTQLEGRQRGRIQPGGENVQVLSDSDIEDNNIAETLNFSAESRNEPNTSASPVMSPNVRQISCPICLDDQKQIHKRGQHLASTVCGHVFCQPCLHAAVKAQKRCPSCRKKLNLKQIHTLFL